MEEDSKYFCRLGKGGGCRGFWGSRSRALVPFVPDPLASPHCWGLALLGSFSLGHIVPHPKDMSPDTRCKHPPALTQEDQGFPGLSIQESTEKPVWKQQQIASVLSERTSVKSCVRGGFQEKSSLTHPGTSPCYAETKNPAGTFWWCLVFCSRQAHISSVALKCLPFAGKLLL